MVTIVFFAFIAFGALAAILIVLESKRRSNGSAERPAAASSNQPRVGRAIGGDD
jgi:hypothetical protein